jgi:membrane associated rhomboid family serine protease
MTDIWYEIKKSFKHGTNVTRLIYINLGVFIVVRLIDVILRLFKLDINIMPFLEMPASPAVFLTRPWTILTYMFLHYDFLHILFNVLYIYWFGRIFLTLYSEKQLVGVYLLGGIFGGFFYLLAYNTFPYFSEYKDSVYLLGASASALAITVASAVTAPNFEINLVLLGNIKLKYLALVIVLIDLLSVTSFNPGGHVAHLGGAFAGYLFALSMSKGKDMTSWINKLIDSIVNRINRKPKMKVSYQKRTITDQEYNKRKNEEKERLDIILDKIKQSGYNSLSEDEKKSLFNQSQKK